MIVALSSALSLPTSSSLNQPTIPLIPATLSSNLTLSSSAGNLTVNPAIRCDGGSYKRDLRTASCLDALLTIPNDPTPITFGTRGSGVFDVPLPHRWISGEIFALKISEAGGSIGSDADETYSGRSLHI